MHTSEILTLVIAFAVAVIGYAQWRTANQKTVIDLYDRRLKAFSDIEASIGEVMRDGDCKGDTFWKFARGQADARFLFGKDVADYLQRMREDLAFINVYRGEALDEAPNRAELIDKKYACLDRVTKFYEEAPEIFGPYIKLTQKITPFWRPW